MMPQTPVAPEPDPSVDMEYFQENLPGYTIQEMLDLSVASIHSATDQTSTLAKKAAMDAFVRWLVTDAANNYDYSFGRAKHLLFIRRSYTDNERDCLHERIVIEEDPSWKIPR